jgi:Protein of unknown function (DUF2808)
MHISTFLGTALAAFLTIGELADRTVQAVELSDGTVYFVHPPALVSAETTRNETLARGATYYFTINVPADAGEPLQRLIVTQQDGSNFARRVEYELEDSRAFVGTRGDRGTELSFADTTYDEETQTVSLIFNQPVPPDTIVTIGLRPERNPRTEGVYLFGVTAFPPGETTHGQFLGYGRFHFYRRSDPFPLF